MIRSMTAYARTSMETDVGTITWELRSVNNRYLDQSLRLPDELRNLDPQVRERVSARLRRGKVDCTAKFQGAAAQVTDTVTLNEALLQQLAIACEAVTQHMSTPAPVSPTELLRWPGVIESRGLDIEQATAMALQALDGALDEMVATREREGEKLKQMILERCAQLRALTEEVSQLLPTIIDTARERIRTRLEEVLAELDASRLEQEMVLFTGKADVAEELDRLVAHIEEVERVLSRDEPAGRRLDFLMQELNREANTLGSKSVDTQTTRASVELKVLIEQMREQVQNIE